MALYLVITIVSLAVLLLASEWFITSAEKIGLSLGISPFIIGVTIVAFGTSLPELATSIASVYSGESEIVAANVIGSNITNILLVLGITSIVGKRINLSFNIWENDMPLLFGSAFLLYLALRDNAITLLESFIFLVALVGFLVSSIKGSTQSDEVTEKIESKDIIKLLMGGIFVFFGAKYTIEGIVNLATLANIGPDIISLTGIALGTSLPEVVVSIAAARRGKTAIAVGNVLGSNIFNTYAVMSIPRFFGELNISSAIQDIGIPFMIIATVIFGIITIFQQISRWEGMLLIIIYAFYIMEMIAVVQ